MADPILYQIDGPITRITLNRPDCLMSNDMAIELANRLADDVSKLDEPTLSEMLAALDRRKPRRDRPG